jgi:pyruvate formate lyase activating enzyme
MERKSSGVIGKVLRIEKTSIHDGTGLRTVVFLKGCPLKCLWCSTPESQRICPEIGYVREKCTLCGTCVSTCPHGALSIDAAAGSVVIDRNKCSGCLLCASKCPSYAIKGYGCLMSSDQVIREIAKDEVFYFHSGGGVTVSGGEPLEQTEFVREILLGCRDRGIHRALETSFFSSWQNIEALLPLSNLVHVDLKHADPLMHRQLTGVDGTVIMENIRRADESPYDFELVIRTPLVPGINDSDEALKLAAGFVGGLRKLKFMEFLAYHRMGTETYRYLGQDYPLKEIGTPGAEYMLAKARVFSRAAPGVAVRINGIPLEA